MTNKQSITGTYVILPIHNLIPRDLKENQTGRWGTEGTTLIDEIVFMGNYFRMGFIDFPTRQGIVKGDPDSEFEYYLREFKNIVDFAKDPGSVKATLLLGIDDFKILHPDYRDDNDFQGVSESLLEQAQEALFDCIADLPVYLGCEYRDESSSMLITADWCTKNSYENMQGYISINGGDVSNIRDKILDRNSLIQALSPADTTEPPVCKLVCANPVRDKILSQRSVDGILYRPINRHPRASTIECPKEYSQPYIETGEYVRPIEPINQEEPTPPPIESVILDEISEEVVKDNEAWYSEGDNSDEGSETRPVTEAGKANFYDIASSNFNVENIPEMWKNMVKRGFAVNLLTLFNPDIRYKAAEIGFFEAHAAVMQEEYGRYVYQAYHEALTEIDNYLANRREDSE